MLQSKIVVTLDCLDIMQKGQQKRFNCFLFYKCSSGNSSSWCKENFIWHKSNLFCSSYRKKIPFVLDTSISMINRGKIRRAEKLGKKIPFGVALDKNGNPTIDPKKALKVCNFQLLVLKVLDLLGWLISCLEF